MPRKPKPLAPKRTAHAQVVGEAGKDGWDMLSRGWPDYLAMRINPKSGETEVMAVTVNTRSRKLRSQQREVVGILSRAGIPCFQWSLDKGWTVPTSSTPNDRNFK